MDEVTFVTRLSWSMLIFICRCCCCCCCGKSRKHGYDNTLATRIYRLSVYSLVSRYNCLRIVYNFTTLERKSIRAMFQSCERNIRARVRYKTASLSKLMGARLFGDFRSKRATPHGTGGTHGNGHSYNRAIDDRKLIYLAERYLCARARAIKRPPRLSLRRELLI